MRYSTIFLSSLFLIIGVFSLSSTPIAHAQITIPVNSTTPCFLNYTAGINMWRNCGIEDDWLTFTFLPWQWISGGYFSMILVSIIIMFTYIKYHKAIYPILIGIVFIPIAYTFFPETFLVDAIILTGIEIAILIWFIYVRQTKEYSG